MFFAHVFEDFSGSVNSFCMSFGVNQAWCHAEVSSEFREDPLEIEKSGAATRSAPVSMENEDI